MRLKWNIQENPFSDFTSSVFCHQTAGKILYIKVDNKSFENVAFLSRRN
jgi:hypothetical protein